MEQERALQLRDAEIARYEREIAHVKERLWAAKEASNGQLAETAWSRHQLLTAENRLACLEDQNATLEARAESLSSRLRALRTRYAEQERVLSALSARIDSESGVVAKLSTPVRHALAALDGIPVRCFTVRCFTNGDERFLALERATALPEAKALRRHEVGDGSERKPARQPSELKPVELTNAEISDFLGREAGGGKEKPTSKRSRNATNQHFI